MKIATGFLTAGLMCLVSVVGGCWSPLVFGDKSASMPASTGHSLAVVTANGSVSVTADPAAHAVEICAKVGAQTQESFMRLSAR